LDLATVSPPSSVIQEHDTYLSFGKKPALLQGQQVLAWKKYFKLVKEDEPRRSTFS
jgi:hypothetical protein